MFALYCAFTFYWLHCGPTEVNENTLKRQTKIAADGILIFYIYLSKKIRLDFSCESSCLAEYSHETSSLIFSEKQ